MNNEIILRIRSPEGQHRINFRAGDTFGLLLMEVLLQDKIDLQKD